MPIQVGDVWRIYQREVIAARKGDYKGLIFRKKGVNRRSEYVMKVNEAFKEVAAKCKEQVSNIKEKGLKLKKYQECVAMGLEGKIFNPEKHKKTMMG